MKVLCDQCGVRYTAGKSAGHCRGGVFGGCCASFGSQTAFDLHRTGPFHPHGQRRCMAPSEMTSIGLWLDDRGVWRLPKRDDGHPWEDDEG